MDPSRGSEEISQYVHALTVLNSRHRFTDKTNGSLRFGEHNELSSKPLRSDITRGMKQGSWQGMIQKSTFLGRIRHTRPVVPWKKSVRTITTMREKLLGSRIYWRRHLGLLDPQEVVNSTRISHQPPSRDHRRPLSWVLIDTILVWHKIIAAEQMMLRYSR
jgi:hypothetical protein